VAAAPAAVSTDDDLRDYFGRRWPEFFVGPDKHQELFQRLRFSLSPYQAAFGRELPKYDLRPAVQKLAVPTLLIVGSEAHYKPDMEWLAQELPHVSLHVFPNVGHFPFVEAADAFLQTVSEFLSHR